MDESTLTVLILAETVVGRDLKYQRKKIAWGLHKKGCGKTNSSFLSSSFT
jgi:hypothetical protein